MASLRNASACTPASAITQKFIHIEQHMEFRTSSDWIAPVTDAFPDGTGQMSKRDMLPQTLSR